MNRKNYRSAGSNQMVFGIEAPSRVSPNLAESRFKGDKKNKPFQLQFCPFKSTIKKHISLRLFCLLITRFIISIGENLRNRSQKENATEIFQITTLQNYLMN